MRSAGVRRFESGAVPFDRPPCAMSATPRAGLRGATVTREGEGPGTEAAIVPVARASMSIIRKALGNGSPAPHRALPVRGISHAADRRYDPLPRAGGQKNVVEV